jgi:hypothetical protein
MRKGNRFIFDIEMEKGSVAEQGRYALPEGID